jgi:hypothetical protein
MPRNSLHIALVTLLAATFCSVAHAQTWERTIAIPPAEPGATGPRLVALPLTAELLLKTGEVESISLFDGQGRGVPAVVHERTGTAKRDVETVTPIESFEVTAREDGALDLTVRLPEKSPAPQAFRFDTPLRDFQRSITIRGVIDGTEKLVAENQTIFDLSKYMDARRVDVRVEPSAAREFRIAIAAPDRAQVEKLREWFRNTTGDAVVGKTERFVPVDQPFRIDRVSAISTRVETVSAAKLEREVPCKFEPTTAAYSKQATAVRIVTDNVPVHKLVVETSSTNFSRAIMVCRATGTRKNTDWKLHTRLSRVQYGEINDEQLEVVLGQTLRVHNQQDELWIEIENGDSPPLQINRVRAYGPDLQLVFLSEPGQTYRVRYGEQRRSNHDTAALSRLIGTGQEPLAVTLTGEATHIMAPPAARVGFWNEPAFLIPVVLVVALGFVFALMRAVRRIEASGMETNRGEASPPDAPVA